MKNQVLYPVIAKEYNDDGHYFVVTSPNVQGMVVEGDTLDEAIEEASYDIADWFEVKPPPCRNQRGCRLSPPATARSPG